MRITSGSRQSQITPFLDKESKTERPPGKTKDNWQPRSFGVMIETCGKFYVIRKSKKPVKL